MLQFYGSEFTELNSELKIKMVFYAFMFIKHNINANFQLKLMSLLVLRHFGVLHKRESKKKKTNLGD